MNTDIPAYLHRRKAAQHGDRALLYGLAALFVIPTAIGQLFEDFYVGLALTWLALFLISRAKDRYEDHQHHKAAGADPTPEP